MQKRQFGKHGFEVSALGFGIMRLPTISPESRDIDEVKAIPMVRYAIDNGVTYIDTAYNYHGGVSELFVAKALKDGYREKVTLATKLPGWVVKDTEDFDRLLNEQLGRLETNQIDCYLLHGINKMSWTKLKDLGVLAFLDRAKADGRIKYAGFSFHDQLSLFKEIIDSYNWDFCMIQLNYMDEHNQAGIEGLRYAAAKELPVVVMEPLLGGRLAGGQPSEVEQIWANADIQRSPAEWALRWIWNLPEVTTVLSGMSSMEQLEENMRVAIDALPQSLSPYELSVVDKVKEVYRQRTKVNCTQCMYCMPCPTKVQIPLLFGWYNEYSMYAVPHLDISGRYGHVTERQGDVSQCVDEYYAPNWASDTASLSHLYGKIEPPSR